MNALRKIGPGVIVLYVFVVMAIFGGYALLQHKDTVERQRLAQAESDARTRETKLQADARFDGCQRSNQIRRESNRRIAAHDRDRESLLDLLHAVAATRKLEAEVFAASANQTRLTLPQFEADPVLSKYVPQIKKGLKLTERLQARYEHAGEVDRLIAGKEAEVKFFKLRIIDCHSIAGVGR